MIKYKHIAGFTLIELMVTLAIIAILAGIGWPTYQGYIAKGHRADAIIAVTRAQSFLEKCYSNTRVYTKATCGPLPTDIATVPPAPNQHFTLDYSNSSGALSYTITATTTAAQAVDTNCAVLTLTNTGAKSSKNNSSAVSTGCWPSN